MKTIKDETKLTANFPFGFLAVDTKWPDTSFCRHALLTTVDYTLKLCAKINAFFLKHLLVYILSQRREEYKLLYKDFEETELSL